MNESIKTSEQSVDYGLVSIVMPNYNGGKYLKETIDSVLSQTFDNWELLFVDDCSTDNSLEIVRSYADERIRIFQNETNRGAAVSRNRAIEAANGRWIAFLDSDDLWLPEKLEKQVAFMKDKEIVFSFTDYKVLKKNQTDSLLYKIPYDKCSYKKLLCNNCIGCLTVVYDSEKIGKVYMPVKAEKREDFACWLSILKQGRDAFCLHEILSIYRLHSKSVSANKVKMIKYQWNVYKRVEKLSTLTSLFYLLIWAIKGVFKYK